MNAREMDRFIAHCDKYLEQTDCTVLHPTLEGMPNAICALELSGKSDVLAATEALPFPALDGKAIPTRFFPKSAGTLLAEAILRQKI